VKANATDAPLPVTAAGLAPDQAVTALYQAHALGLIRLAVVMLGDRPAAEDVVQEAFCGLYRRWHALSDTGKALSYVRSSVINGCRSALRKRRLPSGLRWEPREDESPGNCCWKVWSSDSSVGCSESGSPMRACGSWWPSVRLIFHAWAKSPWMADHWDSL